MCKLLTTTMHVVGMFEAYHMTAECGTQQAITCTANTASMQADTFESDTIVRYTDILHVTGEQALSAESALCN